MPKKIKIKTKKRKKIMQFIKQIISEEIHNPVVLQLPSSPVFPAVFSNFYLYFYPDKLTMPSTA